MTGRLPDRDNPAAFQHQEEAMEQPPHQKGHIGAVPQAGGRKNQHLVEKGPRFSPTVASQGNVQVFPKPGGQGNMPPPPEILDAQRGVGIIEIFLEGEAEHPPQPDGHIAVAAEIKVNLQQIAQRAHPGG